MFDMQALEKYGFVRHIDNSIFRAGDLGTIYMDVYTNNDANNEYKLLARVTEHEVKFTMEDDRLVLKNKDNTTFLNLVVSEMRNTYFKRLDDCEEHYFTVGDLIYKIIACRLRNHKRVVA